MMRLCFGTFATVLFCCKGKKKNNNEILKVLLRTIDPDNMYLEIDDDNFKYINDRVHRLRTSRLDFLPDFIEMAEKANKDEVVQRIECSVLRLVDVDKKEQIVLALLDIIKKEQIVLALLDIIKKDTIIDSHKANNLAQHQKRRLTTKYPTNGYCIQF